MSRGKKRFVSLKKKKAFLKKIAFPLLFFGTSHDMTTTWRKTKDKRYNETKLNLNR